ncbi:MAG: CoA transferase [Massilia sp.]|nr:CoA transferase [Gemmatimonadales bacterium]MDB5910534.1 CoA transferase [Massilia sp.]
MSVPNRFPDTEPFGACPPLSGLKVLDFTWAAAGPVATTFLAFLGADVVKVEQSSRPDLMRVSDRQYGYGAVTSYNESPLFNELASGKRSIELNLADPADHKVALELAAEADVLIENMRPGKFEKLGMSPERLRELNPGLVMCSVSATGRSSVAGPPGYAPVFWAEGGGAWLTGWPDRPPGLVRGPVDLHAAAFACLGIVSLLRRRERTGEGGYLDCSAVEAVTAVIGAQLIEAQSDLPEPVRRGNDFPGTLVNDVFPCAGEDQWLALTLRDEADVTRLIEVLHEQFGASLSPQDVLDADNAWKNIARVSQALDVVELERSLVAAGVPAAQSTSLRTAMSDSRLTERQALQSIFHDALGEQVIVALPWFVDGAPYAVRGPAPVLGADRDDVLREWLGAP